MSDQELLSAELTMWVSILTAIRALWPLAHRAIRYWRRRFKKRKPVDDGHDLLGLYEHSTQAQVANDETREMVRAGLHAVLTKQCESLGVTALPRAIAQEQEPFHFDESPLTTTIVASAASGPPQLVDAIPMMIVPSHTTASQSRICLDSTGEPCNRSIPSPVSSREG
jgi:hypothetical protein